MKATLKIFAGAAVAVMALATVACGKNGGSSNSNAGVNCVQVGATCVATAPGYISNGTWRGQLYNQNTGPVTITVSLSSNNSYGGGYGGGYGYGSQFGTGYGQPVGAVQTIATVSIRTQTATISGTGIATGSAGGFTTVVNTQYGPINVSGTFVDSTQRAMNVVTSGQIAVNGMITGNPDNSAIGGGYGAGGGGNYGLPVNGGYGYTPGYGAGYGYGGGYYGY